MIIANPPNSDENGWGRSGMGDSWEIFNRDIVKALNSQEKLNIKCGDFFQTNITKCSIHSVDMRNVNNIRQVNINYPEMKKCLPFLDQQIEIIQPKIILVFGEIAANVLFEKNENLAFFRKNKGLAYKNIPVIVTDYPPRFPRKNQATNQADNFKHDKQLMWNDLKLFCSIYKEL
jgi:DNA polymerase